MYMYIQNTLEEKLPWLQGRERMSGGGGGGEKMHTVIVWWGDYSRAHDVVKDVIVNQLCVSCTYMIMLNIDIFILIYKTSACYYNIT